MKSIPSIVFIFALAIYVWPQNVPKAAANLKTDDWIRVVSNDSEFSVEVPSQYAFLSDSDGFEVAKNNGTYDLTNMYMLTAFINETLVSFEAYDGSNAAFDAICDNDAFDSDGRKESSSKIGETKIKEVVNITKKYYSIRKFIHTKSHIYILTAANRNADTTEMDRFMGSVVLSERSASGNQAIPFSALKPYKVQLKYELSNDSGKSEILPPVDTSVKPAVVVRATRGSYGSLARLNKVHGYVILKCVFAPDGSIPEVTVVRSLPYGLERQTIFAALRTKFLPKEKDGTPTSFTKTMEFGYNVY
jgi:TonB family protein